MGVACLGLALACGESGERRLSQPLTHVNTSLSLARSTSLSG
jgi:hypothetical protein